MVTRRSNDTLIGENTRIVTSWQPVVGNNNREKVLDGIATYHMPREHKREKHKEQTGELWRSGTAGLP